MGIWAVFLFQGPRTLFEEWILYGKKIMGKRCSSMMGQSQHSLPLNNRVVYLSSHFPKTISKFIHTTFFLCFKSLYTPFPVLSSSKLSSEPFGSGKIF